MKNLPSVCARCPRISGWKSGYDRLATFGGLSPLRGPSATAAAGPKYIETAGPCKPLVPSVRISSGASGLKKQLTALMSRDFVGRVTAARVLAGSLARQVLVVFVGVLEGIELDEIRISPILRISRIRKGLP
jgi:hypothetical protein